MEKMKRFGHGILDTTIQFFFRLYTRDALYGGYLTQACYSPWKKDPVFNKIFNEIKSHSLMDRYKAYILWKLVEQSAKRDGILMEVGVWRGGSGALIAKKAASDSKGNLVYLCDTFKGVVKATDKDSHYKGGEHSDTTYEIVRNLLVSLEIDNAVILRGVFPDETGGEIQDKKIRFCHIDVDTYQSAEDILRWIWPRLVSGGIVVYDDYGFPRCQGIRKHVENQIPLPDRIVMHNLSGQAIIIKL